MKIMPLASPTGRVKLTVYRHTGSYYDDLGMLVNGGYAPIEVIANVQPANRWNQQQQLKEGDRAKRSILVLSYGDVLVADDRMNPIEDVQVKAKADLVLWKGQLWEVKTSDSYEMGVLDHCEAIAVRVDDDSEFNLLEVPAP